MAGLSDNERYDALIRSGECGLYIAADEGDTWAQEIVSQNALHDEARTYYAGEFEVYKVGDAVKWVPFPDLDKLIDLSDSSL